MSLTFGIILFAILSVLFIVDISWFAFFLMHGHSWHYRNPFDRTCKKCGRHEVSHCWSMERFWAEVWWEVFNEGDLSKHTHRKAKLWIASFIGIALYALIILSAVYK